MLSHAPPQNSELGQLCNKALYLASGVCKFSHTPLQVVTSTQGGFLARAAGSRLCQDQGSWLSVWWSGWLRLPCQEPLHPWSEDKHQQKLWWSWMPAWPRIIPLNVLQERGRVWEGSRGKCWYLCPSAVCCMEQRWAVGYSCNCGSSYRGCAGQGPMGRRSLQPDSSAPSCPWAQLCGALLLPQLRHLSLSCTALCIWQWSHFSPIAEEVWCAEQLCNTNLTFNSKHLSLQEGEKKQ